MQLKNSSMLLTLMVISSGVHAQALKPYPGNVAANGWDILDPVPADLTTDLLPRFELRADNPALQTVDLHRDAPWLDWNLNLRDRAQAEEFALKMQKYVYEGMIAPGENREQDFIVQNNQARYWCHTPWLNITNKGREYVHGMTKEFPISASPSYPNIETNAPNSWGSAYFNLAACQDYVKIFGTKENPAPAETVANLSSYSFQDGYVSFKILFNTSKTTDLDGAYTWQANLTDPANAFKPDRKLRSTRHVQMDVAIKDSRLVGADQAINNWVMLTYIFDATYTSPLAEELGLPAGLKNMRPLGVAFGMGRGQSVIFDGPNSNHCEFETITETDANGRVRTIQKCLEGGFYPRESTRLNGPADNPVSSCLGCHAAAGTEVPSSPGMMSNEEYAPFIGKSLDFSQQLRLARDYVKAMVKTTAPKLPASGR